ncbi:MAG: DUF4185 domain-containing protein [Actinobacteria bacterium]|nr:DUF4185 domain-containing protein [Actinomycetota bacterium]
MTVARNASIAITLTACGAGGDASTTEQKSFVMSGVSNLHQIAQLTGPGAINDTEAVAVAGTDLGSMINVGDRTYFLFGDTFGTRAPDAFGGGGGNWRSNAIAYTSDDDPTDGIVFDGWITDDIGLAAELIPGEKEANGVGEVTKIPTYGFAVEGSLYLYFMSVHFWGDPGKWDANYARLARSTDGGHTFEILDQPSWPGDSNFIQVATQRVNEEGEEFIYFWSIGAGRFGGVKLMKAPATSAAIEDPSSYRYFTGTAEDSTPIWSEEIEAATTVLEGEVGELSVVYSGYLDRWLMSSMTDENAVLSEGLAPWGPWSEPHVITTQAENPGLYAPFLNPRYTSEDGKTVYFTMSLWGPYNVFWWSVDLEKATETTTAPTSP